MNHNRFFAALVLCFSSLALAAQSDSEWVLGSAGEVYSANGIDLQWTLGEVVTPTIGSPKVALTQGFNQAWEVDIVEGETPIPIPTPEDLPLNVYPNPVEDIVHISQPANQRITVDLVTEWGQRLRRYPLDKSLNTLDLSHLSQAVFFLRVFDENGKRIKTFKIVKT